MIHNAGLDDLTDYACRDLTISVLAAEILLPVCLYAGTFVQLEMLDYFELLSLNSCPLFVISWGSFGVPRLIKFRGKKMAPSKLQKSAISETVTRDYTINLHKRLHGISFKKRAPRAVKEIIAFSRKHMSTEEVKIDPNLNKEIWKRGIKGVPFRMRLRLSKKRADDEDKGLYTYVEAVNVANPKMRTVVVEEEA